jgi:hypothetical protein
MMNKDGKKETDCSGWSTKRSTGQTEATAASASSAEAPASGITFPYVVF